VATELATVLDIYNAAVVRYEPDGTPVLLAAHDEPDLTKTPAGSAFHRVRSSCPLDNLLLHSRNQYGVIVDM
jgi:hypothetical protein